MGFLACEDVELGAKGAWAAVAAVCAATDYLQGNPYKVRGTSSTSRRVRGFNASASREIDLLTTIHTKHIDYISTTIRGT